MSPRDFSKAHDGPQLPPIPFLLEGQEFHLKGKMPAGVMVRFAKAAGADRKGATQEDLIEASVAFGDFFKKALVKTDYERFMALLDDDEADVDEDQLADLLEWAMEAWGDRPTQPSSNSLDGRNSNGTTSGDVLHATESLTSTDSISEPS